MQTESCYKAIKSVIMFQQVLCPFISTHIVSFLLYNKIIKSINQDVFNKWICTYLTRYQYYFFQAFDYECIRIKIT